MAGQHGAKSLHVLVLDGGAQFSPPIMSALKRCGARVTLGARAGDACPASASRFRDAVVRHPPLEDARRFPAFLREFVRSAGVDVVLPTLDEALVAVQPYRAELERIVPFAIPPGECVASALDKSSTVARAREVPGGFLAPPTVAPKTAASSRRPPSHPRRRRTRPRRGPANSRSW